MGTSLWQPALLEGSTDQKEITFGWYSNKIFPPKGEKHLHHEYIKRQVSWCWNNLFIVAIVSFNKENLYKSQFRCIKQQVLHRGNQQNVNFNLPRTGHLNKNNLRCLLTNGFPTDYSIQHNKQGINTDTTHQRQNSLAPSRSTPPSSNTHELEYLLNANAVEPEVKSTGLSWADLHVNSETTSYWLQVWEISLVFQFPHLYSGKAYYLPKWILWKWNRIHQQTHEKNYSIDIYQMFLKLFLKECIVTEKLKERWPRHIPLVLEHLWNEDVPNLPLTL